MKNKYQRMTKTERKNCRKLYYQTTKGKEMHIRLTRLTLTGIVGLLFSLYIILNSSKEGSLNWMMWLISIILIVASIIFIVAALKLKNKNFNEYALKNLK